jgi:hypothetical protein
MVGLIGEGRASSCCRLLRMQLKYTYFPEPSSVLASMVYHFETDNDFIIRCISHGNYKEKEIMEAIKTDGILHK